jgi:hypothetical protein
MQMPRNDVAYCAEEEKKKEEAPGLSQSCRCSVSHAHTLTSSLDGCVNGFYTSAPERWDRCMDRFTYPWPRKLSRQREKIICQLRRLFAFGSPPLQLSSSPKADATNLNNTHNSPAPASVFGQAFLLFCLDIKSYSIPSFLLLFFSYFHLGLCLTNNIICLSIHHPP